MKKQLFLNVKNLFVVVGLALPVLGFSQKAEFGIKAGANVSFFSASVNSEVSPRLGFHLGMFSRIPAGNKLVFRPEVYFSQQGQKDEYDFDAGSTTTSVNYLNVPLLLEIGNRVSFQGGAQLGFLLSAREKGTIEGESVDEDLKDIMKGTEFALVLGINFKIKENIHLGARLNRGLTQIFDVPSDADFPKVQNNVFHLHFGVVFPTNKKS